MHWLFLLLVLVAGYFRGIHEGMINIAPWDALLLKTGIDESVSAGIRRHAWHDKWYHAVCSIRDINMIIVGAALAAGWWTWWILAASLALAWEINEIGAAVARQGKIIYRKDGQLYERIAFGELELFDEITLTGNQVVLLHAARISWVYVFIVIGLKLS